MIWIVFISLLPSQAVSHLICSFSSPLFLFFHTAEIANAAISPRTATTIIISTSVKPLFFISLPPLIKKDLCQGPHSHPKGPKLPQQDPDNNHNADTPLVLCLLSQEVRCRQETDWRKCHLPANHQSQDHPFCQGDQAKERKDIGDQHTRNSHHHYLYPVHLFYSFHFFHCRILRNLQKHLKHNSLLASKNRVSAV